MPILWSCWLECLCEICAQVIKYQQQWDGWKMILREGFSTAFWKVHVSFLQNRVEDCWIKIVTIDCGIGDVVMIVHIGGGTHLNKFWQEGLKLVSFNKYVLRPLLECLTQQRSRFSRLYQLKTNECNVIDWNPIVFISNIVLVSCETSCKKTDETKHVYKTV